MKSKVAICISLLSLMFVFSCVKKDKMEPPLQQKLTSPYITPEVLWSFGRINNVEVSPDGSKILYGVRYYNIESNSSQNDFYVLDILTGQKQRITNSNRQKNSAHWRPDGKKIGVLITEKDDTQLYEINPDGTDLKQISHIAGGLNDFKYSPDGLKILFIKDVKLDKSIHDIYPDLPKANARLETDLMYRHWDSWHDYTYSHIFVANYQEGKISGEYDIMEGERYDSPIKPFGDINQINWSPDGKKIAYTCKKLVGKQYTLSTNSDIYLYDIDTRQTLNLTEGMKGFDEAPIFSHKGDKLAWISMERDGYESDKQRLFIYDFVTNEKIYATKELEQNAEKLSWSKDDKVIYFISGVKGTEEIYSYNVESGEIIRITDGVHNYLTVFPSKAGLIAEKQSMSKPTEIYLVNPENGKDLELSFVNKNFLEQIKLGKVEKRWVKTTDNKNMLCWVIYPPDFTEEKQYPTLLFCEGGPQNTVNQFWSYRWNFQLMAANGYIIIAPNRRGVPSFGMEWLEQISGDYGGQNMKDYLSAIDDISKEPYVDREHLGAIGASYGGYSIFWLAGNHNKRFKAFIAHDGMFNLESQYLETDEMWFVNWDLGGPFWEKDNLKAQKSYTFSPHKFVQNWDTPILIVHGEKDYRIAYTQGMQAFNAAVLRGIPAEFLFFPEENHWVLKPQDGILWQRVFFEWLDKWLKTK
ncbi:MAG: alpha/beta fold hydrolase [Ignavibacteria bacterium]